LDRDVLDFYQRSPILKELRKEKPISLIPNPPESVAELEKSNKFKSIGERKSLEEILEFIKQRQFKDANGRCRQIADAKALPASTLLCIQTALEWRLGWKTQPVEMGNIHAWLRPSKTTRTSQPTTSSDDLFISRSRRSSKVHCSSKTGTPCGSGFFSLMFRLLGWQVRCRVATNGKARNL
jgi:hypothetical protein